MAATTGFEFCLGLGAGFDGGVVAYFLALNAYCRVTGFISPHSSLTSVTPRNRATRSGSTEIQRTHSLGCNSLAAKGLGSVEGFSK